MENVRLLVVDDDDVDREKIKRLIARAQFEATMEEACSGKEALDKIHKCAYDCILLDYRLGDLTGTEMLPFIKACFGNACAVIMITGLGDEETAVEAMQEGVSDYLNKNQLQSTKLIESIRRSIHRQELERSLKEAQDRLTKLSMYDGLTGLPNRNLFFDRLERAVTQGHRGGQPFSLFMMDLDLFKEVNDTLGHAMGDLLLTQVSERLQSVFRDADTVARLGGDEFAALIVGTESVENATYVAEKVNQAMREPFILEGEIVRIDISIGIAKFPEHGTDLNSLMRRADAAMYNAKREGTGVEAYQANRLDSLENSTVFISNRIAQAIQHNHIYLDYQPIVDLKTGQILRMEALARWLDPTVGLISPGKFIPAAERSSVIHQLTYFLFEKAFKQMQFWQKHDCDIPIAINLSARMLADPTLPTQLLNAIEKSGLSPKKLAIEITETALIGQADTIKSNLEQFTREDIAISIDDFGAGFTSYKYLCDINFSEIKVDQTYSQKIRQGKREASIIKSISTLGEGFGLNVIAEGIEAANDYALLQELGCTHGQGYSICRPLPSQAVEAWCKAWGHQHAA